MDENWQERASEAGTTAHRGYPLSLLFILVGVCGVLSSFLASTVQRYWRGDINGLAFYGAMLGGATILGLIGALIGLSHYRRLRGACIGTAVGCLLGLVLGPFTIPANSDADRKQIYIQSAMVVIGAMMLVLIGLVLRFRSTR